MSARRRQVCTGHSESDGDRRRLCSDRLLTSESEGEYCHLRRCGAHSAQVLVVIACKYVIPNCLCPPSAPVIDQFFQLTIIFKVERW